MNVGEHMHNRCTVFKFFCRIEISWYLGTYHESVPEFMMSASTDEYQVMKRFLSWGGMVTHTSSGKCNESQARNEFWNISFSSKCDEYRIWKFWSQWLLRYHCIWKWNIGGNNLLVCSLFFQGTSWHLGFSSGNFNELLNFHSWRGLSTISMMK